MKKITHYLIILLLFAGCSKDTVNTTSTGPGGTFDKQNIGRSAHDLLASSTYTTLDIEIQYAPGMQPQDQTVTNLVNFLDTYLNKPGGINVTQKQVASIGTATASLQNIDDFEDMNRSIYTNGNHIALYIYFADASYTQANVIGLSFRNTSLVIFEKTVQQQSGGFNQAGRIKVETGTLEHEAGHLLGLVNNGTPMVTAHEDATNKLHCNNSSCLMYYTIETSGLMNMADNSMPVLDANCIIDLRANGGK